MLKTQTKKITAFMSVIAMLFSMLLYFPSGMFSTYFGLKASAATITPSQPSGEGTSDSPYKIGTAAELYWFAACVNGTDGVTQNKSANAVLTADIIVNSNLLSSLEYDTGGNVTNGKDFTSWTPIGWYDYDKQVDYSYAGTFDGQGHTISGLYLNDSTVKHVGLFGFNKEGTVKNVGVIDSYFTSDGTVGGVCGYNVAKITNCYNAGKVIATDTDTDVGGVCGNNKCKITNCYNTGTVSGCGLGYVGGVCGNNRGTIRNCYYDSDKYSGNAVGYNDGTVTDVEGKATAQFNRGEVAYRLSQGCTVGSTTYDGSVWGQTIGTDNYPVLDGAKVYATTGCVTYNNDGITAEKEHNYTFTADKHSCIDCGLTGNHNFGEDNICPVCNTYAISTADQLYDFADKVNNEHTTYKNANAFLTANITVNQNVLKSDGSLADDASGFRSWTPIGYSDLRIYTGTFDGQGHTVSGLYFNDSSTSYVGLFGCVGTAGSVSNVGVVDSYFNGNNNVGGVCGYCNGKITNCYNTGTVSGNSKVGGVCGEVGPDSKSTITNCYNTGIIKGKSNTACVVGYYESTESGKVSNCYYYGEKAEDDDNPPLVTQPVIPVDPIISLTPINPIFTTTTTGLKLSVRSVSTTVTTTENNTSDTTSETSSSTQSPENNILATVGEISLSTQSSSDTSEATGDEHATCKTAEQFASGEVAYLLNGSTSEGTLAWGQTIGTDLSPVLGGAKVYRVDAYAGCEVNPGNASTGYSNTNAPVYAEHSMTAHSANAATCTKAGNYAYWTCSYENGVYYKDAAGTDTFASLSATVIPALGHDMTAVPAKEPTCTKAGNYAYWTCSHENGVYYKDAAGTDTFASLSATVIPALDHDYSSGGICNNCDALKNGKDGFKSASLTLTDGVIINYYLLLSDIALADSDAYIHFTSPQGLDIKTMLSEGVLDSGKYKFSLELRPDQMADVITAQVVYGDGSEGNCINYSVQQYAENVAENDNSKELVDAMLNFGAFTQLYTGENKDNLAAPVNNYTTNASIADTYNYQLDSNAPGISVKGATLQIGAYTTIRVKYQLDEGADINNYTFKCGEAVLEPEMSGDFCYVYLRNICPQNLDEMYSFTVSDGTNTTTFKYSAFTYMKNILDNAESYDQKLVNLMNAMYDYNKAADDYTNE